MATDSELLAQLQAAWEAPVSVATPKSARLPAGLPVAIEKCQVHLPPFDLVETPDKSRPGYFRACCRLCGRFIGYRRAATGE